MRPRRPGGIPAAARYREVRVNRSVYALAAVALLAPTALWLLGLRVAAETPPAVLASMHLTLADLMRQTFQTFAPVTFSGDVVAAVFGIALFGHDRVAGGLFQSLEGPLARRDAWRAKALSGAVVVGGAATLATTAVLLAAAATGNATLAGPILLRGLTDAAGELSLFATALAMGGAMSTVPSALATATWAGLPALLGGLLETLFVRRYAVGLPGSGLASVLVPTGWASAVAQSLANLSPFQPAGYRGWPLWEVLALVSWFLAWSWLMAWQGQSWWERAAFERLHDEVFFPFLWNLCFAWLALATALFVTAPLAIFGQIGGLGWAGLNAATFVVAWFFWRSILRRRGRRREPGDLAGA
jgi:hypothetical protein